MRVHLTDLSVWREQICRHLLRIDFEPVEAVQFKAALEPIYEGNGVKVVRWSHTPGTILRTAELVKDGTDTVSVLLPTRQATVVKHLGEETSVRAGEAIMLRDSEPGSIACKTNSSFIAVLIGSDLLQSCGALPEDVVGKRWNATPALQLLKSYLDGLAHLPPDQQRQLAEVASRQLVELVLLAATDSADRQKCEREDLSKARLQLAKNYIALNFRDHLLDEHAVSAAQCISVRYLQKLFETNGIRFSDYLNQTRIASARAMLETYAGNVNVVDVALAVGFGDVSNFYRMFKRHAGATPLDVRRQALRKISRRHD
jgi:AraC-like DNA-binding protein